MGAQIMLLRKNASVPHPLLWCNEASLLVQWWTLNACFCTLCAVGVAVSASLLSEHLIRRHSDVVGDNSGRSYVTKQSHNVPLLRTRGLTAFFHSVTGLPYLTTCHDSGFFFFFIYDMNECCEEPTLKLTGQHCCWIHCTEHGERLWYAHNTLRVIII